MKLLLAVHDRRGSFSDRWLEELPKRGFELRIVNCFAHTILKDLSGCDALLWHWNHTQPKDLLVARNIIQAVEMHGLKVFPDTYTCWHFDDKIAQKYLLEAIGAPIVATYVFFDQQEAMTWAGNTTWPKVFKLRRGAGAINVHLVKGPDEAKRLIRKAFGRGFKIYGTAVTDLSIKMRRTFNKGDTFKKVLRFPAIVMDIWRRNRLAAKEKGYVYFQDFLPGNDKDTRVTVIGQRAFAFTRGVRPGDFRASGSGIIDYDPSKIDPGCIRIALQTAQKMRAQSVAFDFIQNERHEPRIVEISYCYVDKAVHDCKGHWDNKMVWHEGQMWPQDAILSDLLDYLNQNNRSKEDSIGRKSE